LCVLEHYKNTCFKHFLPSMVLMIVVLFVLSMCGCLKLARVMPLPGFLFLPVTLLNCSTFVLLFCTKASNIYKMSGKYLVSLRMIPDKLIRKSGNSCRALRVNVGSNFIDKLTPLVIIDFSMSQTISLLLIEN